MVGCSGFSYKDWKGRFYPEGVPQREWLEHYASVFPTVEINSTFYRYPKESTLEGWRTRTPEGFELTLKANRIITHRRRFRNVEDNLARQYELADILGDRLGCVLFQLPPSTHLDVEWLAEVLGMLDTGHRNVIEFRHRSWWTEEVYEACRGRGVTFCSVSAPENVGLPGTFLVSPPLAYIRFHGTSTWYVHDYTTDELMAWVKLIRQREGDIDTLYCYFNNDINANAPKNARELEALLKQGQTGSSGRTPGRQSPKVDQ